MKQYLQGGSWEPYLTRTNLLCISHSLTIIYLEGGCQGARDWEEESIFLLAPSCKYAFVLRAPLNKPAKSCNGSDTNNMLVGYPGDSGSLFSFAILPLDTEAVPLQLRIQKLPPVLGSEAERCSLLRMFTNPRQAGLGSSSTARPLEASVLNSYLGALWT